VSAAQQAARVLRERRIMVLSEQDGQMLVDALDHPPPTVAARHVVRDYRSRIVDVE